jgi:hypothetical protein
MQNNTELLCLILEFQSRSLIVRGLLQAESTKEYKANWLKNTDTVVRDGTGRFAKKGTSVVQSIQEATDTFLLNVHLKKGLNKAPFESRIGNNRASVENALNEMGLNLSEVSEIIDDYNNSQKEQHILIKDIQENIKTQQQLVKTLQEKRDEKFFKEWTIKKSEILDIDAQLRVSKGEGYSPEKRLLEAAEILKKEGSTSPRYLWRKAVLKAEVKYGKYLNEIRDDVENSHNELIKSLKKNHNYRAKTGFISSGDADLLTSRITDIQHNHSTLELSRGIKSNISNIVNGFQSIVNIPLKVHIGSVTDNVYMIPGKKATPEIASVYEPSLKDLKFWQEESNGFIDIGGVFGVNNANENLNLRGYNKIADRDTHLKELLWHEMGHTVEVSIPGAIELSQSFLKDRGTESASIKDYLEVEKEAQFYNGMENRILVKDHFFSSYMGVQSLQQGKVVTTELVSSGFEGLSSPWMTKSMTIRDRESLLYAIAVSEMK